jgi:hypothetical protein
MTCRRVLTLAYHYPPVGGAGVQRMAQLSRRLPELGWAQTVITGPGDPASRWRPRDETLEADEGAPLVVRMPGPEPGHDARWEGRRERWLRMPSTWRRWWAANVVELAQKHGAAADVVHASLAPYSTAESAVAVARLLGRPLVLDLEDPWALDEMLVYPTALHRRAEERRMRNILAAADVVVMNTPEARDRVCDAFPSLSPERVVAIPNAYDPLDLAPRPPRPPDGRFLIVHTGSLHTEMGQRHRGAGAIARMLGGAVDGVDFLPRSHVFLIEAVQRLLEEQPDLAGRLEIHLAGVFTEADRAVAARCPAVRLHEFLPHDEALTLLASADLLFCPMHDLPAGRRAGLVPQKTYEYLATGRPILGAVPDGDARDLLAASGVARLCRPADVEGLLDGLRAEIALWRAGAAPRSVAREVLEHCAADRMAAQIGGVYASLGGPVPAARV